MRRAIQGQTDRKWRWGLLVHCVYVRAGVSVPAAHVRGQKTPVGNQFSTVTWSSSRRGTWVVRLYAITFTYWAISSACVAVFWKYKGAEGGLILFPLKRIFKNQKGVQGQNRATPENVGSGVQR